MQISLIAIFIDVGRHRKLSISTYFTIEYANESITASFMSELLKLRDGYLDFSGVFHLDQSGIATLIDFVATA